ncbi:MAG TPA: TIGR03086 family protein, partial [Actinomycetes bacterium]|nr:TIGR03086 family protein [Actinomycetes bacterium]
GAGVLASAGAIEIAVHGWDIARACGRDRPVPDGLAVELLSLCPLLVGDAGRGDQFAAPVPAGPTARPGDRLLALLGRDPAT